VMSSFSDELSGLQHYFVDLQIKDVTGGSTSFVMRFNFDHSEGSISGDVGSSIPVTMTYYAQQGNNTVGGGAPYLADVSFDASRSFVGVKFKETSGISSIGAGAQLFPGNALQ
jgi:hypothetical protein